MQTLTLPLTTASGSTRYLRRLLRLAEITSEGEQSLPLLRCQTGQHAEELDEITGGRCAG